MLVSTEGIVLHSIKYGESSVIATIYTRDYGRQSYLVNAARSKKAKNKSSFLQPLFLVDLVAYQKQKRDLHRIKELKINHVYQNLSLDISKSALVIFLAEILYKSIHEHESHPELYDFIKNSLLYFDLMEEGAIYFHLWFLLRLTKFLGFQPELTKAGFKCWFDMKKGAMVPFQPSHPFFAQPEVTESLLLLSTKKIHELNELQIKRSIRDQLISVFIEYYRLHLEEMGEIKSLGVLREVFQ